MSNNRNPHDLEQEQIRSKTWGHYVSRATVLDVLPDIHAVRVNERDGNAPFVAPVITPTYGSHTLPNVDERVLVLYVTDNTPVVLGSVYLADGEKPPTMEPNELRFGNDEASWLEVDEDGQVTAHGENTVRIENEDTNGFIELQDDGTVKITGDVGVSIDTNSGDVNIDPSGNLNLGNGAQGVITDITTTKDADGHVTDVSITRSTNVFTE